MQYVMHRAFIDDLTFESFLEKQGKLKTWSWKKYWFVLDDDQLAYYKDTQVIILIIHFCGHFHFSPPELAEIYRSFRDFY